MEPTPLRATHYVMELVPDFGEGSLSATATLTVRNPSRRPVPEIPVLLYRLLKVTSIRDAGGVMSFRQHVVALEDEPRQQVNAVTIRPSRPIPPGGVATFTLVYQGYLAGYEETGSLYIRDRIAPSFTILRTDAIAYPMIGVPSRRANHAAGFPEFDYRVGITVPDSLTVANGGRLIHRRSEGGRTTWTYGNLAPAWRMDFAIAPYRTRETPRGWIFHFPQDSAGAVQVAEAVDQSLRLFTRWFGPPLGPAGFSVIEVPDGWGSQRDVTAILQTASAFRDPERLHEVYHEVSHAWHVKSLEPASPRLEEGLASHLEVLASDSLLGGSRAAERIEATVGWLRTLLERKPEFQGIAMKDFGRRNVTDLSYSAGSVMFAILHRLVGEAAFREIVGGYHRRYHATGGTTTQFVAHASEVSPVNLTRFFDDWIESGAWSRHVLAGDSLDALVRRYR